MHGHAVRIRTATWFDVSCGKLVSSWWSTPAMSANTRLVRIRTQLLLIFMRLELAPVLTPRVVTLPILGRERMLGRGPGLLRIGRLPPSTRFFRASSFLAACSMHLVRWASSYARRSSTSIPSLALASRSRARYQQSSCRCSTFTCPLCFQRGTKRRPAVSHTQSLSIQAARACLLPGRVSRLAVSTNARSASGDARVSSSSS
jgi:hypothetical protein